MNARTTPARACTDFPPTVRGRVPFGPRMAALVRRGWCSYWERRARRATVFILRSLDERTLRDIGISPSEIPSCVYGSDDRLRRYDRSWPWRPFR